MYIKQLSKEIIKTDTCRGAIINAEYDGFIEDYLVLHCLLRRYAPKTFLEVGTNEGRGTEIIANALIQTGVDYTLYSLDLPYEQVERSLQHPMRNGKKIGHLCSLFFKQILWDSLEFDYAILGKLEGAFIDGEHDHRHAYHETLQIINQNECGLLIWHDANLTEVWSGLTAAIRESGHAYELFRVTDTRIAYAIRK